MKDALILDVRSRQQWRRWLARNHASSSGIWLVFHKDHTGVKSIPYEDSVREALCFGFTPRKPTSKWSNLNRKRWAELKAAGLLAGAGLAAAPTDNKYAPKPEIPELPAYIAKAFKEDSKAWKFFRRLAPGYRRHFVVWIHMARRAETREKRLRESMALLAKGKKLGLK